MSDRTIKIIALIILIALDFSIVIGTLQGSKFFLYVMVIFFSLQSITNIMKSIKTIPQ